MDSEQYKSICEQPNVFRLRDLNETLDVLRKENMSEVALIAEAMLSKKVEKATFA